MPKLPEQLLQPGLLQPAKSWVVAADRGGPRRSAVTAGRLGHMHACQRVTCMSNWAEMASHNSTYAASIHNSVMQPVMLYGCCSLSAAWAVAASPFQLLQPAVAFAMGDDGRRAKFTAKYS